MTGDNQDVLEFLNQTKAMYDEDSTNYMICKQAIAAVMGVQKAAMKLAYIHRCIDLYCDREELHDESYWLDYILDPEWIDTDIGWTGDKMTPNQSETPTRCDHTADISKKVPFSYVHEYGLISRRTAVNALWKALREYEDKTEKQFVDSEELNIDDWFQHRIFVQNMSDIDRQTILGLPSAQPERGYIDQIRWERDTAIQQLKELGYSLGEKPRTQPDYKTDHGYMWLCPECGLAVHSDYDRCVRCGWERRTNGF